VLSLAALKCVSDEWLQIAAAGTTIQLGLVRIGIRAFDSIFPVNDNRVRAVAFA
jgi:hypothetical protein